MTDPVLERQIGAATAYEDLFVPALFREWAPRMADAADLRPGQRVLDVACGTGILAREAAARVMPGGSVAGLDPNAGMLAVAERLAPDIEWQRGLAESLPYPDRSFDAVVSQFGLMFFDDRSQALREMLRVVVSGGRLALAVWTSLDENPAYRAEVELAQRLAGDRAAEGLRAPFVLGDPEELTALLEGAGAGSVSVTTAPGVARFPSIRSVVEADLRGWLPVVGVDLPEEQIRRVLDEAEPALGPWVRAREGGIEFDMPAQIVTASKR